MGSVSLTPRDRASFAVMTRLISCLVTERILRAFYVPLERPTPNVAGLLVVLSTHTISEDINVVRTFHANDVFAVVPLSHEPVLQIHQIYKHCRAVGLVDPLDMLYPVYECRGERAQIRNSILGSLGLPPWELPAPDYWSVATDPVALWKKFVETVIIDENLRDTIAIELRSSLDWQEISFKDPPSCPDLNSASIEWEQSLVSGHPTHPMHRARMFANGGHSMEYDWYHPRIRFVRVPAENLDILGHFGEISRRLVSKAATKAGYTLDVEDGYIYMPVHELQLENISSMFQNIEVLDRDVFLPALAQSSIRTVVVPDFPGIALKLAVGVKISSSLRTISHFTANFGPRFSKEVVPKLTIDPAILAVELESSSAVYHSENPEVSKHFTAVIRDEYQARAGEIVIVVAALLETGHANVPEGISALQHTFKLDTERKRESFMERYIQISCQALLPALINNGVAFEAHAQNVLARFDIAAGELRGFVFRDLGGLRIHPETLRQSTGVDFQFLPGHCVATKTLGEIYPKFYHTFVHNHIQRMARLLGLHYNGRAYEMLRKHMGSVIPKDHPLWKLWMDPSSTTVDSKCLMRMRMRDSYRDMVYSPYPNMIQYRPSVEVKLTAGHTFVTRVIDCLSYIRRRIFTGA